MFMKIHRSRESPDVVAVCDRELINTTISGETMTVTVTDAFYGKSPATEEEIRKALQKRREHQPDGRADRSALP